MTRIDLLPPRYHQFRTLTRQVYWGLVGLAALLMILGTVDAGMRAQATAYARASAIMVASARQYRTINARFDQLQQAEKTLKDRKSKAVPLLDHGRSILPAVSDFTNGLPSGTRLVSLSVELDGKVSLEGETRSYKDVSRFVKWVGDTLRYENVVLTGVKREGGLVTFTLVAVKPAGGEAE